MPSDAVRGARDQARVVTGAGGQTRVAELRTVLLRSDDLFAAVLRDAATLDPKVGHAHPDRLRLLERIRSRLSEPEVDVVHANRCLGRGRLLAASLKAQEREPA